MPRPGKRLPEPSIAADGGSHDNSRPHTYSNALESSKLRSHFEKFKKDSLTVQSPLSLGKGLACL